MLGILEKYCPKCGYRIRIHEERFCHGCGIPIKKPKDTDLTSEDVNDIPFKELSPIDILKEEKGQSKTKDTLLSVSYIIAACGMVITLLLVMAQIVGPMYLPIVIMISLIGISLLDGFHPRNKKDIEDQFIHKPQLRPRNRQQSVRRGIYITRKPKKLILK